MEEWVFVDTCVWASFFDKAKSVEKVAVGDLLVADRAALTGPIVYEVLLGFRRKEQADWVASRMQVAHYVEAGWQDWRSAANIGRELAANGSKLPLTDLVVAAIAKRCGASVYSIDPHFDLIPDLKRFWPSGTKSSP